MSMVKIIRLFFRKVTIDAALTHVAPKQVTFVTSMILCVVCMALPPVCSTVHTGAHTVSALEAKMAHTAILHVALVLPQPVIRALSRLA